MHKWPTLFDVYNCRNVLVGSGPEIVKIADFGLVCSSSFCLGSVFEQGYVRLVRSEASLSTIASLSRMKPSR